MEALASASRWPLRRRQDFSTFSKKNSCNKITHSVGHRYASSISNTGSQWKCETGPSRWRDKK